MSGQPEPRVVGVSGSLRAGSKTRAMLCYTLENLSAHGARTQLLDLAASPLPFFSGYTYPEAEAEALARFKEIVAAADIVILASPEYHGAPSGSLKNALDHLPEASFRGKIVGLIGVAGGSVSPVATTMQLRSIVRALGGVASPCELLVAKRVIDDQGNPVETELLSRAVKFTTELTDLCERMSPVGPAWEAVTA